MKRTLTILALFIALAAVFCVCAQAEVQLVDYHALHMDTDLHYYFEFTEAVYRNGFRQYSQPISSNDILNPQAIAEGKSSGVPESGEVLVTFIENSAYAENGEVGFRYRDQYNNEHRVPLDKVQTALAAFPGHVVVIVNTALNSTSDRLAFVQALTAAFSGSKFTLAAHVIDGPAGATRDKDACKALGYNQYASIPLDKIYADTSGDRIVTALEFYNYFEALYKDKAVGIFSGSNLPIYFSTVRLKLELPEKSHRIAGCDSFKIVPIIEPAGATQFMTWSSSNKSVATVLDGVVTGVRPGKAVISLKADKKTLKMTVTVTSVKATGASVSLPEGDVYVGDKVKPVVKMEPVNATDPVTSWTSSDKKVATVDKNGVVTALRDGNATISIKTKSGFKVSCALTVKKIAVTGVEFEDFHGWPSPLVVQGTVGLPRTYQAHVLPRNASFQGIRWTSTDSSVASVDKGKIKLKKPGYAVVRAASVDDPSIYFEVQLTVKANQTTWAAPNPEDYATSPQGLYALPKRLYYSGSKLMAEVYVFNHKATRVKLIGPFYACLIDLYYFDNGFGDVEQYLIRAQKVKKYTFSHPIEPEGIGVYKFTISTKGIIDLTQNPSYAPMLFG
jgi:uncharacterized protein YjdB